MASLGINIGSSSLKIVFLNDDSSIGWFNAIPHEGNFPEALRRVFSEREFPEGTAALVTGTEGRELFAVNSAIEPLCLEEVLATFPEPILAVVSMGGEDLVVYTIGEDKKILTTFTGSKCASGTGEFFRQQLARMDMSLPEVNSVPDTSRVLSLSTRCSVFMKSDCTHRLNKREASKDDIVVSLSDVMATKVTDFLSRARIHRGTVLLSGGTTQNRHFVRFLKEKNPGIDFLLSPEAPYLEAYGAALLAGRAGSPLPPLEKLLKQKSIRFSRYDDLKTAMDRVAYHTTEEGPVMPGREYILGVDGGSTTTKACLIDFETNTIVASHYGRTHGDPVGALKKTLKAILDKAEADTGGEPIKISLAATTGSSREILGVFLQTSGVYNEIIAHSVGTIHFKPEVDTVYEIGGQDAKYVLLRNKVPIDYAMNEACSAGTGSFLEESAQGDLNIQHAWEIGEIALKADKPLKFGEHCSAFINSDIRKAIQQGATREDITAGIVTSIVSNYLNRVVGNRTIGSRIFLQGGVAKNKAVPLAFAMLLDKDIIVPPCPELMGCFGVGLLARQKWEEGSLEKTSFDLARIIDTALEYERTFTCKSCDNYCEIQVLSVNGEKYLFGGRCSKYTNSRRKARSEQEGTDWVKRRMDLMFADFAPPALNLVKKRDYTVGIPRCFSVYSLYPLYAWFFHSLGIETLLSQDIPHEGVARVESTYCFPAEIAHGAVQDLINRKADYLFLPHFRDMESYERDVHANFCPITQGLPYYIKKAFPEIGEERILPLVVSFKFGKAKAREYFIEFGRRLGFSEEEAGKAFEAALEKQEEYSLKASEMGREALALARKENLPVIALLGRPYNAFTKDANMGIPKKFTSRGYSVIPFDILPFGGEEIFRNMYWFYGQQDMKTAVLLKNEPNVFITFITNFSCAPDSFLLHYLRWYMGVKPFLILELDSHSADAGIDTRVEAFLDIIAGYRSKLGELSSERYSNGLSFVNNGRGIYVLDSRTGEKIPVLNNPRVTVLLSNMGDISTKLTAAVLKASGIKARALPVADHKTIQLARAHASGKECVPSHIVLGSALKFLSSGEYNKGEIYLLFVPETTGPCRTGQYSVFFDNLFKDLRVPNVVVFTLSSDNSYTELGPDFSKNMWWALAAADYLKDAHTSLRACAEDRTMALTLFDSLWKELLKDVEKDLRNLMPALERMGKALSGIPLVKPVKEIPRVLIVGEIYVRRDDFAVDELIDLFSSKRILGKVSGVSEWIHYTDFVRKYDMKKRFALAPWYKKPFSRELRKLIYFTLEEYWKDSVEKRIKKALSPSGLVPPTPHNMNKIMGNTEKHFLNLELNSEIAVSSGVAATAMQEGYSGIVNISPFACLIGRVIEGLFTPWARERGFPVISVEVDGNLLPPNMINKLDIFMLNVLRFKGGKQALDLVVSAEIPEEPVSGSWEIEKSSLN